MPDADGVWGVAANWSSNPALPGAADDVLIDVGGTTLRTVTHGSGTTAINSLHSKENLVLSGGSLTLLSDSLIEGVFTLSGTGARSGNGNLLVSDGIWTAGTFGGAGTTSFSGSLVISGNAIRTISGGHSLHNAGTVTWTNEGGGNTGLIQARDGSRLVNDGTWLDQTSVGITLNNGGGSTLSRFDNAGAYVKSGASTTAIAIGFDNSGSVDVEAGTLALYGGGSQTGSIDVAAGATLHFGGGVHTLDGVVSAGEGGGRALISGGTVNAIGSNTFAGELAVSGGGTLNIDDSFTVGVFSFSGGTRGGNGSLSAGDGAWTGGTFSGTGTTSFDRNLIISGHSARRINSGHTLRSTGTVTWTNENSGNLGWIEIGGGSSLINDGTWLDQNNSGMVVQNMGGAQSRFDNTGAYIKSGAGPTSIGIAFDNSGTLAVENGTLNLNQDVIQHSGNILTGGTWRVSGNGILNLNEFGAVNVITNQGDVTLDGAAASFARIGTLTNNEGAFRLLGNRGFSAVGAFGNSGVLQLGGGSFSAPALSNTASGEVFGFGTVTPAIANSGLVRATGGTLTAQGGIDGQSGTIQIDPGATLVLGAASDADHLINDGTLDLGAFDVTVAVDYSNANFGSGNAFDARANVIGSGAILAAGDTAQALTGEITNGAGATPVIDFGHLHVGDVLTRSYRIANTGSAGASLRGALQTAAGGGNLTDARLSGSGVTAGDFGPIAVGGTSEERAVMLSGTQAGALSGQTIAIVNNFDNLAEQVLAFEGAVYRYAEGQIGNAQPIDLGAYRVGDASGAVSLAITNTAIDDEYSEHLNAAIEAVSAGFTANGSVSFLAPQATDASALSLGVDTAVAGEKTGSVTVGFVSDGTGTSGLGQTARPSAEAALATRVYAPAVAEVDTASIDFGIVHVGDTPAARGLAVRNAGSGALTDVLLGNVQTASAGYSAAGTLGAGLAAGAVDDSAMTIALDTSTAGVFAGEATLAFASHDAELADLSLGTALVTLSAQVNEYANPLLAHTGGDATLSSFGGDFVLDFGRLIQGDAGVLGLLTLSNFVSGPADALRAEFAAAAGPFMLTGFDAFSGLAAGAGHVLSIGFDPLSVGLFEQTVDLDLFGHNASGYDGYIGRYTLNFRAEVAPVPVPAAGWLLASALGGLWMRRRRAQAAV